MGPVFSAYQTRILLFAAFDLVDLGTDAPRYASLNEYEDNYNELALPQLLESARIPIFAARMPINTTHGAQASSADAMLRVLAVVVGGTSPPFTAVAGRTFAKKYATTLHCQVIKRRGIISASVKDKATDARRQDESAMAY